ncbi:MAG: methyltransferase domain-containing protein [Phycisphaeraceae bacterium]|nr:MAG: methyltransferase domain-containing protein [Phycisphaeraceae bacterium]
MTPSASQAQTQAAPSRHPSPTPNALSAPAKSFLFFTEFFRSPRQLGAWFSSPPRVARALAEHLGLENARAVAELGPGTGPVTAEVLRLIPPSCRFFAIEKNERLANEFRRRFPGVDLVEGSASELIRHSREREMLPLDAVVSSLPWILFPKDLQREMIRDVASALKPGGRFSMITYRARGLPLVRRLLDLVHETFSVVEGPIVVRSRLSPAYIYRCTK